MILVGRCYNEPPHEACMLTSSWLHWSRSIMLVQSAKKKSQTTGEGHLRKRLTAHHIDKAISLPHTLQRQPSKMAPSWHRPPICTHTGLSSSSSSLSCHQPASLSPIAQSFFSQANQSGWVMKIGCPIFSSRLWVGEGQCIQLEDWSLWTVLLLMYIIYQPEKKESSR